MEIKLTKLFSEDECFEIVNFIEQKTDWKYVDDSVGDITARYYRRDLNDNDFVINKFKNFVNSTFSFTVENVNIYALKYLPGCMFGRHYDRHYDKEKNKDFVYNINVVLNEDFSGGEFWLDDKIVKNNKLGMAYYYNSVQWHEVKPITKGVRYSMLCFVRERDFISKIKKSIL